MQCLRGELDYSRLSSRKLFANPAVPPPPIGSASCLVSVGFISLLDLYSQRINAYQFSCSSSCRCYSDSSGDISSVLASWHPSGIWVFFCPRLPYTARLKIEGLRVVYAAFAHM